MRMYQDFKAGKKMNLKQKNTEMEMFKNLVTGLLLDMLDQLFHYILFVKTYQTFPPERVRFRQEEFSLLIQKPHLFHGLSECRRKRERFVFAPDFVPQFELAKAVWNKPRIPKVFGRHFSFRSK
jgi:hypothetical protein